MPHEVDIPNPSLSIEPEEMRRLGYLVVDMLVDHWRDLPEKHVAYHARPGDLRQGLHEPVPEHGAAVDEILATVSEKVLTRISHVDHPRFFGFIPSPNNFVSVLADALISGTNVFSGSWISGAGAAIIEEVTIDWMRTLCGFPETAGGLFVSGGSMANLTALAAARHVHLSDRIDGSVVYLSDQVHSSVDRALAVLGFRPQQLRKLPSTRGFAMDLSLLTEAISADRRSGLSPFCVVASAGTTNTGSIDPLAAIAGVCRDQDLWFHVDGAYGAAAVISPRGAEALSGIAEADSLALDPHKWLFQPYEIGCVLVKRQEWLIDTFRILPEYLHDTRREEAAVNFCDYGIQLTRSFRALKIWMSIKAFGMASFRLAVERGFELAELAEGALASASDWEIVTPASMGIVTFRFAGAPEHRLDELNRRIAEELSGDGFAFLSTTRLRGRTVLRLCTINPRTGGTDIRETIRRLDSIAHTLVSSA